MIEVGLSSGPIFANLLFRDDSFDCDDVLKIQFLTQGKKLLRRIFLVQSDLSETRPVSNYYEAQIWKFFDILDPSCDDDALPDV